MKSSIYGLCFLAIIIVVCSISPVSTYGDSNQSKGPVAPIPTPQIDVSPNAFGSICYKVTFQTTSGQCVDNISLYQDGVRIAIWYNDLGQQLIFEGCFSINIFTFFIANFSIEVFQWRTGEFGEPMWRINHNDVSTISSFYLSSILIGVVVVGLLIYWKFFKHQELLVTGFKK
jgi:hypothetical protein